MRDRLSSQESAVRGVDEEEEASLALLALVLVLVVVLLVVLLVVVVAMVAVSLKASCRATTGFELLPPRSQPRMRR